MLFQQIEQIGLEQNQVQEVLRLNAEWMAVLLRSSEALSKSLDLNEILQTLTDSAAKIIQAGSAAVYLQEDDLIYLGATTPALPPGFPENLRRAPLADHPHIKKAIASASPLVLPDTQKAVLTPAEREVSDKRGLRTIVYFPLKGNKKVHGAYIVASTGTPIEVSKIQMTLCHTLGTQASIAIENARLYRSVQNELEERKLIEKELRASEEKYRLLVENQTDLMVKVDHVGRFLFVSQSYCRVFGKKEEELLGRRFMPLIHKEDRESVASAMKALFSPPHTAEVELRFLTKEGWKWIAWSNSAILDNRGTVREVISVGRDITERKRAENENTILQAQLIQALKMESIGRLAGGVAHDFNNMLNVILGNAELVLDDLPPDNPLRVNIEEIRSSAERSANLTRQLLAFARKQAISPKILNLNECVASMIAMVGRLIGEDIELVWKPGRELELVCIDPGQIDQLLANLVVNARDAIGRKIGKVTIETANTRFDKAYCALHPAFIEGDYVELAVSDDGCGMDRETLANIFDPFFTTKGVDEGTGLGLSTVYGIVKQNNGFVNVYSKPGQGATFRIYLPAHKAAKTESVTKDCAAAPDAAGHETILVVEDEQAILKIIQTILEKWGYRVFAFATPEEAIRQAESYTGRIDLLITDVVMPGMNGRDLANNLAAIYPGIRSLFMSGYTANVIAHKGVLDKGIHFIQKPFSAKEITNRVRKVLDRADEEKPGIPPEC